MSSKSCLKMVQGPKIFVEKYVEKKFSPKMPNKILRRKQFFKKFWRKSFKQPFGPVPKIFVEKCCRKKLVQKNGLSKKSCWKQLFCPKMSNKSCSKMVQGPKIFVEKYVEKNFCPKMSNKIFQKSQRNVWPRSKKFLSKKVQKCPTKVV